MTRGVISSTWSIVTHPLPATVIQLTLQALRLLLGRSVTGALLLEFAPVLLQRVLQHPIGHLIFVTGLYR